MYLPPYSIALVIALTLLLGINVALFTLTVIIPSFVIVQGYMYALTGSIDLTTTITAVLTGLWIMGFAIRYARGEKLPALIRLPEYGKVLVMVIALVMIPFIDLYVAIQSFYMAIVALLVKPIVDAFGVFAAFSAPLGIMVYMLASGYMVRALERIRGDIFTVSSIVAAVAGLLSFVTLSVTMTMVYYAIAAARPYAGLATYVAIGVTLISLFAIGELREAFVELKPEAIIQIPAILTLASLFAAQLIPEIHMALNMFLAGFTIALNTAAIIAGLGLGSRRLLESAAMVNSALLFVAAASTTAPYWIPQV